MGGVYGGNAVALLLLLLLLQVAVRCPAHFSAAVDVLEAAMPGQPELLDALLLPSGLDPQAAAHTGNWCSRWAHAAVPGVTCL